MNIFRPSELHPFLQELGARAKKSLSQNFLIDGNILTKMMAIGKVGPGDYVIEIGPGPGALTEALLQSGAHVLAIEKDKKFAASLERLQTKDFRLEIVCTDALFFPFDALERKGKVIANLPYQITTPLLNLLLPLHKQLDFLLIMVQREVAQRLTAKSNSEHYSSLSLFIQLFADAKYLYTVEPTCFFPKPKVKSALVLLDLKPPPAIPLPPFLRFIKSSFQQRRKMLRTSLKTLYGAENVASSLEKLGLNPQARPEELSLEEFIRLFQIL